jgi:hypothetical protein
LTTFYQCFFISWKIYKSHLPSTTWDHVNQREIDENAVIFVDNGLKNSLFSKTIFENHRKFSENAWFSCKYFNYYRNMARRVSILTESI